MKKFVCTVCGYVYEGDNKVRIYLTRSLDSSTWYSFEILKGNTILGGGRH